MLSILKNTTSRRPRTTPACLTGLAILALTSTLIDLSVASAARAEEIATPALTPAGQQRSAEFLPPPTQREEHILAELDEPTSVEFVEEPLQDVINDLKDLRKIEIQLDSKALEDAGIASDTAITLPRMQGISFKAVLGLLRKKYGLCYLIQDEMLLITTKDVTEAEENLVRKVYPVGDLVDKDDYDSLIKAITTTIDSNSWQPASNVVYLVYPPTSEETATNVDVGAPPAPPSAPSAPSGGMGSGLGGGPGALVVVESAKGLVISQTRDVHDKVLDLLRSLRAARKISDAAAR